MHRVDPAHAIRVLVVVEVPVCGHPIISRADVPLHVIQGKDEAELAKILPHVLRHPVLVHRLKAYAATSICYADMQVEVSAAVTSSPMP